MLSLDDVRIGAKDASQGMFAIPRAELAFDLYALFQRNRAVSEFRLSGVELKLLGLSITCGNRGASST